MCVCVCARVRVCACVYPCVYMCVGEREREQIEQREQTVAGKEG